MSLIRHLMLVAVLFGASTAAAQGSSLARSDRAATASSVPAAKYHLLRKPFTLTDGHSFFAGVPQREAIAGLNYFLTSRLNAAQLLAPQALDRGGRQDGFGTAADAHVEVHPGIRQAGGHRCRHIAIGNQANAAARIPQRRDDFGVSWAIQAREPSSKS